MPRPYRPRYKKFDRSSERKDAVEDAGDSPEVEHLEMAPDVQDASQHGSNSVGATGRKHSRTRRPNSYTSGLHCSSSSHRYGYPNAASNDANLRHSAELPSPPQPVKSTGQLRSQSFVDAFRRGVKRPPILDAGPRNSTNRRYPDHIGFSYLSKPPRWVIMPVTKRKAGEPDQALQWVFDAGETIGPSGLRQSELYKIGYKYLQDAYADPVFRENMRSDIRSGPFALKVADVEDPLPLLPPPPPGHQYVPPAGAHSTVEYFRGYERPLLATRPGQYAPGNGSPSPTSDNYSTTLSDDLSTNTFDRAKSLDTRYSGSSDLENQRSYAGPQSRFDEGADDGPILHVGDDPRSLSPGSRSHSMSREVYLQDEYEITDSHQAVPENRDTVLWAPWDVITRLQQEGGHDKVFPAVVHRRIPVWAGSFVDKDISAAASNALPREPSAARMFRSISRKAKQGQKRKTPSE